MMTTIRTPRAALAAPPRAATPAPHGPRPGGGAMSLAGPRTTRVMSQADTDHTTLDFDQPIVKHERNI